MATVTGIVSRVIIKSSEADPRGFCKMALQVNGQYHNGLLWQNKTTKAYELKGDFNGKQEAVAQGDTVSFETTTSGAYTNIDTKSIKIISKGTGQSQQQAAPFKKSYTPKTEAKPAVDWEKKDMQMNIGGLLHDATAVFQGLCAAGAFTATDVKKMQKDTDMIMGIIKSYTQALYRTKNEIIADPTGEKEFDVEIPKED